MSLVHVLLVLAVCLIIFGGGGHLGYWGRGDHWVYSGGGMGLILLLIVIMILFGR